MFGTKIEIHSYFLKTRRECFRKPQTIQNWTTNLLIPAVPFSDHSKIMLEYSTFDLIQQELQFWWSFLKSKHKRYRTILFIQCYEIALSLIKLSFDCNELKLMIDLDERSHPFSWENYTSATRTFIWLPNQLNMVLIFWRLEWKILNLKISRMNLV